MHSSLLTILPIILLSYTPFSAAASADCFTQQRDSYTKPSDGTSRVSVGVACPNSEDKRTCPVETGGFLNFASTLNITTKASAEVFETIGNATNTEIKKSVYGAVTNGTFDLEAGRTGFYGFTATYRCYAGTFKDCIEDIPSGTAVEACTPETLKSDNSLRVPALEGTTSFVNTDSETIANMTTNPAATVTDTAKTSGPPNADSGAIKLGQRDGLLLTILVAMGVAAYIAL